MFNVLIVDDNAIVCKQLKRLQAWGDISGFVIAGEANNGQTALNKLRAEMFDLVITDIRMPKVDGIELLVKVTEEKLAPCVVLLSEFSEFRYAKQGLVYGAFDYLVKPVEIKDLVALLMRVKQKLQLLQREQRRFLAPTNHATAWAPTDEVNLIKQYIKSGSFKAVEIAGVAADMILSYYADEPARAGGFLRDILQELVSTIVVEFFWIDKYTDLQELVNRLVGQPQDFPLIKRIFVQGVEELYSMVRQFAPQEEYGPIVREVSRYILENIDGKLTTQDIATALFINRTYMSEVFREKSGMTVSEYLTGMKMVRAKRILGEAKIKMVNVAEQLGYSDVNHFSRQFKKHVGVSPSEFKIQVLGADTE
jgi:two-component system, response regulator YesN